MGDQRQSHQASADVLEYESRGRCAGARAGMLPGLVGCLLIPVALVLVAPGTLLAGVAVLVMGLGCGIIQMMRSVYRARVGDEDRLRVRPWAMMLGLAACLPFVAFIMLGTRSDSALTRRACQSNLLQIEQGIAHYIQTYGKYPASLTPLLTDPAIGLGYSSFVCPSVKYRPSDDASIEMIAADLFEKANCSYVYVGAGLPLNAPDRTVLAYEKSDTHHREGAHVLLIYGMVEFVPAGPRLDLILKATTRPIVLPAAAPDGP